MSMKITLSPSTYLKDKTGKVIGEPGQTLTVTDAEAAALIRTGSAIPAETPAAKKES